MSKYYPGTVDEDAYIERMMRKRKRLTQSITTPSDFQIYGSTSSGGMNLADITDEEIRNIFKEINK